MFLCAFCIIVNAVEIKARKNKSIFTCTYVMHLKKCCFLLIKQQNKKQNKGNAYPHKIFLKEWYVQCTCTYMLKERVTCYDF